MQRLTLISVPKIASLMVLTVLLGADVRAAELGDALVRSHIGQPLVADIELTSLAPDEAGTLRVRIAHPDVYRGANISMHPVLASLNMGIMRRDNRQFLHITSIKPVDASYVHVFFELIAGNRSSVRGTTLWLTQDPNPPPPPPLPPPLEAVQAAVAVATVSPPIAKELPSTRRRAERFIAPAACVPQAVPEPVMACVGLDSRNAALTAQIVQLENKVMTLQQAMAVKLPPVPTLGTPPVFKAAQPAAKKATASTPWAAIGGGVALLSVLIGIAIFLLRRGKESAPAGTGDRIRQAIMRPFRGKKLATALAPPVAPTIE